MKGSEIAGHDGPRRSKHHQPLDRHANQWAEDRGKVLIERNWLDRFLSNVPEGGKVLDLGCGSGQPIAAYSAGKDYRITGVDASPNMIAMCRDSLTDHEWLVADMRGLRLGKTFDGILAWDSFFHLTHDDQRRMFETFKAHSHAGTVLMFTSGPQHGEAIGSYMGEDLYHASLSPEEYRALLTSAGFEVVAHRAEDQDCGGHTVWLAKQKPW